MKSIVLLIIGFGLLIKGADLLVDGAAQLAKKFKISDIVIGLTVVAFGTSTPELFVNVYAGVQGTTDIAIGNILGSNTFNILLILGVTAIIAPVLVTRSTFYKEIPFSLLAAVMVLVLANDVLIDGKGLAELSRIDGIVLLGFFAVFMAYVFAISKDGQVADLAKVETVPRSTMVLVGLVVLGLTGLVVGGKFIVDAAIDIARSLGVSEALIGLTVVAAGTSLPELATSVVAAKKKNTDIAVGNIVGSNIFNIFFILGVSAVLSPLPFNSGSNIDIIMVILSTIILMVVLCYGRPGKLGRSQGLLFLALYAAYMFVIIRRG